MQLNSFECLLSKDESIGSYIETNAIEITSTSVTTSTLSFESETTRSIDNL